MYDVEKDLDLSLDYEIKNININLLITEQENDPTISPILNFVKMKMNLLSNKKGNLVEKAGLY